MTELLVDVTKIAAKLGVQPNTVHQWRKRYPDFPEPFVQLAIGPVWYWAAVERWAKATGRL